MKKFILLYVLFAIVFTGFAQTVHRVNNNPGITGTNVYSTFALAHTAAAANDIILIEPSNTSYGDISLTKPLKIYGNGYFLNTNTELKVDQRPSIVGTISFNANSGGSEVYGLSIVATAVVRGVSNIKIQRCSFLVSCFSGLIIQNTNLAGTSSFNVSDIIFSQNYVTSSCGAAFGGISINPTAGFTITNTLINNNIFPTGGVGASNDPGVQSLVIRNNTFLYNGSIANIVNAVFENNLLAGGSSASVTFGNVTASFNVSTGNTFPNQENGNKNNYSIVNVDTNESQFISSGAGISDDERWQLKPGAELKTLGSGDSEVGAYGGSTPYKVSGIPPIPSIVEFFNTGTGDTNNPLKVNISVKSNN
jgi:hypothetical protein